MRIFSATSAAALVALCLVPAATAISNVTRVGRYLYNSNGRFYIKGIAYQEQGIFSIFAAQFLSFVQLFPRGCRGQSQQSFRRAVDFH
jgi:hypothetical protein